MLLPKGVAPYFLEGVHISLNVSVVGREVNGSVYTENVVHEEVLV